MKKKILCLAGWAQKYNSLEKLFDNNLDKFEIINFNYSKFDNFEEFSKEIQNLQINPDIILGWSLGGQLSCRLIESKIFNPNHLILLSTPFQFVKSKQIGAAMPQKSFNEFRDNFNDNPDATLKKFSLLMNINDKNARQLADNLDINEENHQNLAFWLDELERFSCFDVNFDNFPETLIFHGTSDLVVHHSQSENFQNKIENANLQIIKNCGHTPHITYQELLIDKMLEFIK